MTTLTLYSPVRSPLHRVPAGLKLALLAGLSVLLFAVPRLPVAAAALGVVLLAALAGARMRPRAVLAQVRPVWLWLVALLVVHLFVSDLASGLYVSVTSVEDGDGPAGVVVNVPVQGSGFVGIEKADPDSVGRHCCRQVHRHRRLADPALAGRNGVDPGERAGLGERDLPFRPAAA